MSPLKNNPYMSSKKAKVKGPWWDTFAKSGQLAYLVFDGSNLLAKVENEQQAKNVVWAIKRRLPNEERKG